MLIPFDSMETSVIPNMKGGEKEFHVKKFNDEHCRIMLGTLIPGATIGLHTHEGDYEVIYVLSGVGTMVYEDSVETLTPGTCHYCPEGKTHSFRNESEEDVVFFAIVPKAK